MIYHPYKYSIDSLKTKCECLGIDTNIRFTNNGIGYLAIGKYNKYVIYCYGNSASILNMLKLGKEYSLVNKITVILFDYPGYGISHGNPSEGNINVALRDVLTNFDKVHLIGESLGTGVALSYAATFGTNQILSIRLISPFTSLIRVVSNNMLLEMFYDMTGECHYRSYHNIMGISIEIPISIYSLLQDELISSNQGKILSGCRKNVYFTEISDPNFGHSNFGNKCVQYKL